MTKATFIALWLYTELALRRFSTFSISRPTALGAGKQGIYLPMTTASVAYTPIARCPSSLFRSSSVCPFRCSVGHLLITDAIGRDVCCNKFALNVRPVCCRLPGTVYQSARAVHVIDDVISHDDDDVINYVRPADTGKSIVTTDIRRAGWSSCRASSRRHCRRR